MKRAVGIWGISGIFGAFPAEQSVHKDCKNKKKRIKKKCGEGREGWKREEKKIQTARGWRGGLSLENFKRKKLISFLFLFFRCHFRIVFYAEKRGVGKARGGGGEGRKSQKWG